MSVTLVECFIKTLLLDEPVRFSSMTLDKVAIPVVGEELHQLCLSLDRVVGLAEVEDKVPVLPVGHLEQLLHCRKQHRQQTRAAPNGGEPCLHHPQVGQLGAQLGYFSVHVLLSAVHMDQDVVVWAVDLFDQSVHLSAGSARDGQKVNNLDIGSSDLTHSSDLGGYQGDMASAVNVHGEISSTDQRRVSRAGHVAFLRGKILVLWKAVATETLHSVLDTGKDEPVCQTVFPTFLRGIISFELDHVSLEQSLVETVLETSFMFPGSVLIHFTLAISRQRLRIDLALVNGTNQVGNLILTLIGGGSVYGTDSLLGLLGG